MVENGTSVAKEITERHGATYVHLDEGNVAQARNRGVEEAGQVDAVAFLDDDVVPHAGWLERIVAPILAGSADATIGGIHVVTDSDTDPRFCAYVDTAYALDPEQPFLAGLNMAVRPDSFQAVGGFICECAPREHQDQEELGYPLLDASKVFGVIDSDC